MKRFAKIISLCLMVILSICCLFSFGCGSSATSSNVLNSIKLPDIIPSVEKGNVDLESFKAQGGGYDQNNDGVIVSPYYKVTYNGNNEVFSYATPMYQHDLHSIGYIEATKDMFPITVTITSIFDGYDLTSGYVIPEKLDVKANAAGGKITFTITSFDYYTVLFNDMYNFERPYTLIVREYEEIDVPSGYKLIEYKAGIHYVDRIVNGNSMIQSNTLVYLHAGAYLICKQPDMYTEKSQIDVHGYRNWSPFIYSTGTENIIIRGHGIIDCSQITEHARTPVQVASCKNVKIEGITIINSPSFTLFVRDCVNVYIKDVVLLGYRINSDGIVLVNCRDVTVENCFVKSGDDLCEVKATYKESSLSQTGGTNITYRHCQAWAEKTRCFGFIQESEMDVDGILYEDCSAIYQNALWDDAMGAFNVCVGDNSTIKNVKFKDCDAYYVGGYAINICLGDNQWTTDQSSGCSGQIHNVTVENFSFHYLPLKRVDTSNKIVAIQLKNKKTVQESKTTDFTNMVFNNIKCDGIKIDNREDFDSLVYYNGAVDKSEVKFS